MVKSDKNQSLIVKVICLLLSLGLWLYIANVENPVRSYELRKIPVELINLDSIKDANFAIAENQQFTVDLKLEGSSSEVINAKREDFKIVADMSAYALKTGDNTIPVQIRSYPENLNIKNSSFLGIKVKLEDLIKKELAVTSKVNVEYKSNIYEKDKAVTPNKITISGARSLVDKVTQAVIQGDIKEVGKDIKNTYDIKFLDELGKEVDGITADQNKAQLSIVVINGKSVPINLKTTGTLKNGLYLEETELSKKNINIIGASEILEKIKSIDTEALDISKIEQDGDIKVKLNIPKDVSIKNGEENISVNVKIKKDENISKNIECNVNYINLKPNFILEASTQKVNVSLSGNQSILDNITANNIDVSMDLADVNSEGEFEYTPKVTFKNQENLIVSSVQNVKVTIKNKV